MKKVLVILSFILLLVSCKKEETTKIDNPLINNVNLMAKFLFDIHVIEALEDERYITYPEGKIFYAKTFTKYGITPEQFDSAAAYYTINKDNHKILYEKIQNRMRKYIEFSEHSFFGYFPAENINVWKDYAVFPENLYKMTQFLPYYITPRPKYLDKPLIIEK
jgi:hypothetical protein